VTTKLPDKIAWDAMVLIDCLEKKKGRIEHIEPIVREAEQKRLLITCSTLIKTECFKIEGMEPEKQIEMINGFLANEYFEFEALHDWISERAQSFRREHKLSTQDAVHAATAIYTRTPILLTRDGDGEGTKRRKLLPLNGKLSHRDPGGKPLTIITPAEYCQLIQRGSNPLFNRENRNS
jgi:predicted nucleic acid-binding protein